MSFLASEEITAALNKGLAKGSCHGVVVKCSEGEAQIALRGLGLVLRQGDHLHLRSQIQPDKSAWVRVEGMTLAGDVKLVAVSDVRYESEYVPRAARFPIEVDANAVALENAHETQIGRTLNVSLTGALVEVTGELGEGATVNICLHFGPDQALEAVARVVRVNSIHLRQSLEKPENKNCFHVGLEFQRFVRGYEFLTELVCASTPVH